MANEHITVGSNSCSYEKLKTSKYLGSLLTDENYIHEEIKLISKYKLIICALRNYNFRFQEKSRSRFGFFLLKSKKEEIKM